jgi:hypothetical protein
MLVEGKGSEAAKRNQEGKRHRSRKWIKGLERIKLRTNGENTRFTASKARAKRAAYAECKVV